MLCHVRDIEAWDSAVRFVPATDVRWIEPGSVGWYPLPAGIWLRAGRMNMRIAVMAAGALGGYFGARMAAAGHDVFFIARGANLEAIRKNGLKVESVHGNLYLPDPDVTDDPAQVGPVDIVLFAVKLWDSEAAAASARPLVGAHTRVIPLQNGVDSAERLAPILGADQVVAGS